MEASASKIWVLLKPTQFTTKLKRINTKIHAELHRKHVQIVLDKTTKKKTDIDERSEDRSDVLNVDEMSGQMV